MASRVSDRHLPDTVKRSVKIGIVGGFGVGKTTFVGAVSEIVPLRTEERMTQAGEVVDDLAGMDTKTTTTVAMDFGRITLSDEIALYLFGGPGQERFRPHLINLLRGTLGAVVLLDTRNVEASFPSMGLLEDRGVHYIVAVNQFNDAPRYSEDDLRAALDLLPETPLVFCDAREHQSARQVLIDLVKHLVGRQKQEIPA